MFLIKKLTDWIKCHQIAAFFIITFMITWGLGFSYSAAQIKGILLLYPVASLATCGPALAGIIITALTSTQPRRGTRRAYWITFFVAWIVSAFVWLAHHKFVDLAPLSIGLVVFILFLVAPVAFVISMVSSRIPELKNYLASLFRMRGVWGWAVLALVSFPALIMLSIPISNMFGRQPIIDYPFQTTALSLFGLFAVKFFYQFFFYNAFGEEVGWRGFALPRLEMRTSPLVASLIVACFWIPWHFFLWQSQGQLFMTWNFWMNNFLIVLSSITLTWFYNRSNGSILVCGILHAAENTTARVFLIQNWYLYLVLKTVFALTLILIDRMWKKFPPDHPAVYQVPVTLNT
jgi:membrane protease YdiL (CAAX protease family)